MRIISAKLGCFAGGQVMGCSCQGARKLWEVCMPYEATSCICYLGVWFCVWGEGGSREQLQIGGSEAGCTFKFP